MAEEIQEAVQIIRVAYDGIEIAMKVGSGGIAAMQKAIDFLKGMQWLLLCITPARETICPAKNMVQQDLKIRSRSIRYWRIKMRISTGYSVRM